MRRLLLLFLMLALCAPNIAAKRKKDKSGSIKSQVFTDKKYDFQLTIDEGWKPKVMDNNNSFRLIMVQKNYEIPPDYLDNEDYTQVPRLVVWADTSSAGAFAALDSLFSDSFNSDQKSDMLKEFEILHNSPDRESLIPKGRKTLEIAGEKGIRWVGYSRYMKEVALSASSSAGKRVRGAYGGTIVAVKKGDLLIMFHMMCEWQYYPQVDAQVMAMVQSLSWGDTEAEKDKDKDKDKK